MRNVRGDQVSRCSAWLRGIDLALAHGVMIKSEGRSIRAFRKPKQIG